MEKFVFREETGQARVERQIRRLLEIHRVVNADQLALESGLSKEAVRSLVEQMISRREVERLRPLDYTRDDLDFFRLCRLPRPVSGATGHRGRRHSWDRWLGTAKRAMRVPILGRQSAYS